MRKTLDGDILPESLRDALKYFEKKAREIGWKIVGYKILGKHARIVVDMGLPVKQPLYLVFQREPFKEFSRYFGVDDVGLTINCDILETVCSEQYYLIVWVLGDGKIYAINPCYMLRKSYENKWFRTTKTNEKTCHIPSKMAWRIY